MKFIKLYEWFAGTQSDFTQHFQHDETLYSQARNFWNQLDGIMIWVAIAMLTIGIGMACIYYKPFNNLPGRHYTIKYWSLFLCLTVIVTGIVTYILEHWLCEPRLYGANGVELRIASVNALYSVVVYLFTSLLWCLSPTNTNAYTWFKRA